MKRKVLALILALTFGGSVSAYAATCSQTSSGAGALPGTAVQTLSASCPAAAAVLSRLSSCKNSAGVAAVKSAGTSSCKNSAGVAAVKSAGTSSCKNSAGVAAVKSAGTSSCKNSAGVAAVKSAGTSSCANNAGCAAVKSAGTSSCAGGTVCIVNGSACNASLCQNILQQICGKTCTGSSCPSAQSASSAPKAAVSSAPKATASSTTKSAASSAPSASYSAFQNEVVRLVNAERAKNGLSALSADALLMKTATVKSQDMAKNNYFSHTSPTYGSPFDLMKKFGVSYRTAGENIAMGQTSPAQVMNGWMNSAGHRANILNASYTKIGVGVAQDSAGRYYWTQHFVG